MTAVLALQGAFAEHMAVLTALGEPCYELRNRAGLMPQTDALILPGGESTTMRCLLEKLDLLQPLQERIRGGMAVFGTCAGMILLARELAQKIESELNYPGQIKVNVVRETRAVEYAK